MRLIYTPQAKSFLSPEIVLYKQRPPAQLIPYMVRASGVVRQIPYERRQPAIKVLREQPYIAWAEIHRELRPYFFTSVDGLFEPFIGEGSMPIALPDLDGMNHIHNSMHYMYDMLEDLDRVTAFLRSDPSLEDADERIQRCWQGFARTTHRLDGTAKRLLSGRAFNNT